MGAKTSVIFPDVFPCFDRERQDFETHSTTYCAACGAKASCTPVRQDFEVNPTTYCGEDFFDCAETNEELAEVSRQLKLQPRKEAEDEAPNALACEQTSATSVVSKGPAEPMLEVSPATRVLDKARNIVSARLRAAEGDGDASSNNCRDGLSSNLELGVLRKISKEFDDWVNVGVAKRMLRWTLGNEKEAIKTVLRAVELRVRDGRLLDTMSCKTFCDARVLGRDTEDRPVLFMSLKTQTVPVRDIRDQVILTFEAAARLCDEEDQFVCVIDFRGLQASLWWDLAKLKEIEDIFSHVFADRPCQVLFVDFSRAGQTVWWFVKPIVTAATRKLIEFVSVKEAKSMAKSQWNSATYKKLCTSLDMNRDPDSSLEDLMMHARRTAIGEAPFGPSEAASCSGRSVDSNSSESTDARSSDTLSPKSTASSIW